MKLSTIIALGLSLSAVARPLNAPKPSKGEGGISANLPRLVKRGSDEGKGPAQPGYLGELVDHSAETAVKPQHTGGPNNQEQFNARLRHAQWLSEKASRELTKAKKKHEKAEDELGNADHDLAMAQEKKVGDVGDAGNSSLTDLLKRCEKAKLVWERTEKELITAQAAERTQESVYHKLLWSSDTRTRTPRPQPLETIEEKEEPPEF